MAYESLAVDEPLPCPDAFSETDERAMASQAALLLLVGGLLNEAWMSGACGEEDEWGAFPLPDLGPARIPMSLAEYRVSVSERYGVDILAPDLDEDALRDRLVDAAGMLYKAPDTRHAAHLVLLAALSRDPLLGTAAAVTWADIFDEPGPALAMLFRSAGGADLAPPVREIAATALARMLMAGPLAMPLTGRVTPQAPPSRTQGLILVHGTFLFYRVGTPVPDWWRPKAPNGLHDYILNGSRPDIYAAGDHFEWEGGYSDHARFVAARHLTEWLMQRNLQDIDAVTHSHGGNMAFRATELGARFRRLVVLSCPVHWGHYRPLAANVGSVQSIRVKRDLVITADRADQRFRSGTIPEHVLPKWFDHSYSHEPAAWQAHNLDRFV